MYVVQVWGTNMAFTAKVYCTSKTSDNEDESVVTFAGDYADGANNEWSKYTPVAEFRLRMKNSVADSIETSQKYTVTFQED